MKKTEILIVGHGLAGSLMAWELQQAGIDFMVMNAPRFDRSSDVAAGLFNPLMFRKLRLSRMVQDLWPVMEETYNAIESSYGIKILHHMLSAKMLSNNEIEEWEEGRLKKTGPYIRALEKGLSLKGLQITDGLGFISSSGFLDIAKWLELSKNKLTEKGKFIEEALVYKSIEFSNGMITLNKAIEAQKIIFCEGAAVIHNPWFNTDWFTPNKGELLEIFASGLDENYILRDGVFILPLGNQRFKVGATYSHDPIDTLPSENGKNELIAKLDKMISVSYKITAHYAGVRPAIKDRMPVVGAHGKQDNLFFINGLGSRGVVFAPYCAKALVKNILPDNEPIPDILNIQRFAHSAVKNTH